MTDTPFEPAADDELLSAYLLGELPDADAEAFETRLGQEPALAAQLDALAGALVSLGGHDEVGTPEGFDDRLDERLRAARSGAGVVSLDAAREQRARSRGWWTTIGTVAAVVAVGGVMAAGALRGIGSGGDEMAAEDAGTTMESATSPDFDDAASGGGGTASAGRAGGESRLEEDSVSADAAAPAAPPTAPLLLDDQAVVRGEAALRKRYAGAPEADALLGTPVEEARSVAASFTTAVQRAEGFVGGGAPADCLETVTTAAEQPLIPARVETLRYRGQPALSYLLVTATPGSDALDRVEVWVVDASSCATLVFQQL